MLDKHDPHEEAQNMRTANLTQKPQQAVILAGGRGKRLSPITDNMPKPMVSFHGRPFLEYLLEYLKSEGFTKVLLLLGYLPDSIIQHFGDGSQFGLKIEYSVADENYETGLRLKTASKLIDPLFFMMYCDNYCPVNTDLMWEHFEKQNTDAQITIYSNLDAFTKNNLTLENGLVTCYDKSRQQSGLNGVDIGFAFLKRECLDLIPQENFNFEKEVYPQLVRQRKLSGYLTHHRYYSVGNLERLPVTEKFLKRDPVILLDRDGVLNQRAARGEYITRPEDFKWIDGSQEAVVTLKKNGFKVLIISNQAGIARGKMSQDNLHSIHQKMQKDLGEHGAQIDGFFFCPHGWDEQCFCRKPSPGLLFQAQREHSFDLTKTLFIGDDERDVLAGQAAGTQTYFFQPNENLNQVVQRYYGIR